MQLTTCGYIDQGACQLHPKVRVFLAVCADIFLHWLLMFVMVCLASAAAPLPCLQQDHCLHWLLMFVMVCLASAAAPLPCLQQDHCLLVCFMEVFHPVE
jgi:hypothetical protein